MTVLAGARELLREALVVYAGSPQAAQWLRRHEQRLDESVRIAVAGAPGIGKSTLVRALAGTRALREATLVDDPAAEADAVLHLVRRPRGRELAAMRSAAAAPPVHVIAVLARADEAGAGRVDAGTAGRRLARRYRRDPEVRAACQDVVAVAGLVAHAARTLAQPDVDALSALARLPRVELDALLLSADRYLRAGPPADPALLDRLGIYGIRLATSLIRTGAADADRLRAELVQRSGLADLREAVRQLVVEPRDVLKARSALLAVDAVLRAEPRAGASGLVVALERALASAHEFRELRLLPVLRDGLFGDLLGDEELDAEAWRLVGGQGPGLAERLGVGHEPGAAEARHLVLGALKRWQAYAEAPDSTDEARRAARVVVRSCEGMLAAAMDPSARPAG